MLINDTLPGILLLINGFDSILNESAMNQWLPYVNIAAGAALVVAVIKELKSQKAQRRAVNWFDILAGIALILEGASHYHSHKIFQPADGYILIGIITIVRGMFHAKLPRIRRMVLTSKGITARFSPFRRIHVTWTEITSLHIEQSLIRIRLHGKRERLMQLRRIENREEVKSILKEYAMNFGIDVHNA